MYHIGPSSRQAAALCDKAATQKATLPDQPPGHFRRALQSHVHMCKLRHLYGGHCRSDSHHAAHNPSTNSIQRRSSVTTETDLDSRVRCQRGVQAAGVG
jgi:hypothetical protein